MTIMRALWLAAITCVAVLTARGPAVGQESAKKLQVAKNIHLEVDAGKRRVLIDSTVCLRQGQLEQLLTRKRTKEHEAILVADIDAREVHRWLTVAGAEAGSPVKFQPKLVPPTGTPIKVSLEYKHDGKLVRRPAQEWIRDIKTKKPLAYDWVF